MAELNADGAGATVNWGAVTWGPAVNMPAE
jgi:hypothetical protein